ncbi:sensor histidine kinase, partial [Mangrovactinospora gilvigrisea]|uniref:sensor histidine kinase n=1 Tax=Mangrovactinospora gilvigrisea TaxID=1428644 RepID=UPI000AF4151F
MTTREPQAADGAPTEPAPGAAPGPAGGAPGTESTGRDGMDALPAGRHARRAPSEAPPPPAPPSRGLRSIRARVVALLMVPVVALLALWAAATVDTAQDIARLQGAVEADTTLRTPVAATVTALQDERRAAAVVLAAPDGHQRDVARSAFGARVRATDATLPAVRRLVAFRSADTARLGPAAGTGLADLAADTAGLGPLRAAVRGGRTDQQHVLDTYGEAVSAGLDVGTALAVLPDTGTAASSAAATADRALPDLARAREQLAREDTVLAAADAAGTLSPTGYRELVGAARTRAVLTADALPGLRPADAAAYRAALAAEDGSAVTAVEQEAAVDGPGSRAAQAAAQQGWPAAGPALASRLAAVEDAARASDTRRDSPYAAALLTPNGLAVLLGVLAVLAALLISVRIGRGLVVELGELRDGALRLARDKLPRAMRRLRAGERIDIDREAPLRTRGDDEISQVGEALDALQRAALTAAAERAELLHGVSGVFVNLARRSQVLVHRQLTLLDQMERRTEDPSELQDLFRLDHLTTRMRRHAEGLIILSGAAPGRAWRRPVPLVDVVRAAVAEVEEYQRVEVRRMPKVALVGGAVADLTHLLAELVDNATVFSPPNTTVRIRGEKVGTGFALEIEDRGLG